MAEDLTGRVRRRWRVLVKEVSAFGIVGVTCFAVDLGLFQLLYAGTGTGPVVARLISALVAMSLAFVGHRYWSFSHRARTGIGREYGIFFVVNGVTLALGLAAVGIAHHLVGVEGVFALQAVNVGSIAAGTLIRFVAYRRWVFVAVGTQAALSYEKARDERARRQGVRRSDAAPEPAEI